MKMTQHGSFDESLESKIREDLLAEFTENDSDAVDFAACQRPDGSIYGIPDGKQCKKGKKVKPSQRINKAFLRRSPAKLQAYLRSRNLYPYQRKAIEAELKRRGIGETAAIRERAQKPGSEGVKGRKALGEKLKQKAAEKRRKKEEKKTPSLQINKQFLLRSTTQKLNQYLRDRKLYKYQREKIEAELRRRGYDAGKSVSKKPTKATREKPSMQVNKRFLQEENTQKLQEYLNNRKLYKYQKEKIEAELKRRSGAKKQDDTKELLNKAIRPGATGREARLELGVRIREREAKRAEREKDPKVKALLRDIDKQLDMIPKRRQETIYQRPDNKKFLDSVERNLLAKRDKILDGKIKPPSKIKKPYGLDSSAGVIVNKKLLRQDTSVLQEILRKRSLNSNQRAKIEEEVAGRGETPASAKKPQRNLAAKAKGAGWVVTEGVKGYNPIDAYNRKDNVILGEGAMGKAFRTKGPPPGVVKQGAIGEFEVKAWQALQNTGRVPEFHGAVVSKNMKELDSGFGGHVKEARGYLGLGEAKGRTLSMQRFDNDQKRDMIDEYIRARKDIHKAGVAHNDMHGGNFYYDQTTKKAQLIDFGLAQVSPKAALMEALGTNQGDWQSERIFAQYMPRGDEPQLYNRFRRNQRRVLNELENEGFDTGVILGMGIRTRIEDIDRVFESELSDSRARQLIDQLYEGV